MTIPTAKTKLDRFALSPKYRFALSEAVFKPEGYPFPGIIVAAFTNKGGDIRYVVEHDCGGLLHIFSELQLRKRQEATL